jgi:hypothetical protein
VPGPVQTGSPRGHPLSQKLILLGPSDDLVATAPLPLSRRLPPRCIRCSSAWARKDSEPTGGIHFRRSRKCCWDPATASSLPLLYHYPDACHPAVDSPGPTTTPVPSGDSGLGRSRARPSMTQTIDLVCPLLPQLLPPIISDPANAYVHVSEAHTTHIWIDICVCI